MFFTGRVHPRVGSGWVRILGKFGGSGSVQFSQVYLLPRDATQSAVMRLHVVRLSVCLSVRLSVCDV